MKIAGRLHRLRRPVQLVALGLFVALGLGTAPFAGPRMPGWSPPSDLFIRLDPLAALSSGLAARVLPARFAPALMLVAGTLLVGRAWCGWLCPLGTVLDLARGPGTGEGPTGRWHRVRFAILFALIGAALLSNQSLLVLDPLTLLTRALGTGLMFSRWGLAVGGALVRGSALPIVPTLYLPGLLPLGFLGLVVALNWIAHRFWCRALCPLGALLGLIAQVGWLRRRVGEACSACGQCARECPVMAPDLGEEYASEPAECIVCLTCQARCPRDAVAFAGGWDWGEWKGHDPTRRQVLASLAAGAVGAWLLQLWPPRPGRSPRLIRPPGTQEEDLLSRCARCGECVTVCPSGGLQPVVLEAGWEGVGTPALIPRLGWCSYDCCLCGQVCPTEAIPRLTLEEKRQVVMGIARIDRERCIPWDDLRICTVCYDTCPLLEKAILLEKMEAVDELGQPLAIRRPRVLEERCTGCGVCEYNCPVAGQAAIRVYAG
jgi:polyferredoxin